MKDNAMRFLPLPFFLLALYSCNTSAPAANPDCEGGASGQITATAQFSPGNPQRHDLVVTGTAADDRGLAIRSVTVSGVLATNTGFNFSTWTATVPAATLAAQADSSGQTTISVVAVDSCGATVNAYTSPAFAVDLTPGIRVDSLQITLTPPGGEAFIPANGSIPASLRITANPEAAGAVVAVSASIGTIDGAVGGTVVLSGDGHTMPAAASLLYQSTKSGNALVTASAKDQTATAAVLVAGPPLILPISATVGIGQKLTVTAISDGSVDSCAFTATPGLAVSSTQVSPTRIDITVDATKASAGDVATGTCRDAFGQQSSVASYSVP